MTAQPKSELMRKTRKDRRKAGLVDFRVSVKPETRTALIELALTLEPDNKQLVRLARASNDENS